MALTKAKKVEILKDIKAAIEGATSAVFVSFNKLTVHEADEMRAALKHEGVRYTVVKKTLLAKSMKDAGVSGEQPDLPGEVALAYLPKTAGDDMTAPARGLQEFVKKFSAKGGSASGGKDKLVLLGGVVENAFASRETVMAIAAIPSVSVLRGMFVNIINSPIQRFAIALGEVTKKKV
jgi:large subunit ribosomal protein L10